MLAGDLAAAGVRCTVAERRTGESNLTRAFAVHARTLEQLDARGVADELDRPGHPGARAADVRPERARPVALPSRFPFTPGHPAVRDRAGAGRPRPLAGADIRDGAEVIGLRQVAGRGRGDAGPRRTASSGGRSARPTWSGRTGCTARSGRPWACRFPGKRGGAVGDAGRRAAGRAAHRHRGREQHRRRVRPDRAVRRRLVPGDRLETGTTSRRTTPRSARTRSGRPSAPGARHRLRHARAAVDVPVPQRRAPGAAVPGRPGVSWPATPPTCTPRPAARA